MDSIQCSVIKGVIQHSIWDNILRVQNSHINCIALNLENEEKLFLKDYRSSWKVKVKPTWIPRERILGLKSFQREGKTKNKKQEW